MNLSLSNRLLACAGYIRPGDRVADIGCDHGYLGIHLLRQGLARSVIAADINPMPLESARRNARKFGVSDRMEFFLCDGVQGIPKDFDALVCAGVGADTMVSILSAAPWLRSGHYRLVLQCQSKVSALRRYLSDAGFAIIRETLAQDGKFIYPVMEVRFAPGQPLSAAECWLSPALLDSGSALLLPYAQRVIQGVHLAAEGMRRSGAADWQEQQTLLDTLNRMLKGDRS